MTDILTAEKLSVEQFIQIAPARVVQQGRRLHSEGKASVQQSGLSDARVVVEDPDGTRPAVHFSLAGGAVGAMCSCYTFVRNRSCQHLIAAALTLRQHLYHHPPSVWKAVLGEALQRPPRRANPGGAALIFSLQPRGQTWAVAPYTLAGRHLPPDHAGDPDALASVIAERRLVSEARPIHGQINPDSYPTMPPEAHSAAALAATGGSFGYWYGAGSLRTVLRLLENCLVYLGAPNDPFNERVRVISTPGTLELEIERNGAALEIKAALIAGERRLALRPGRAHLISRDPPWALVEDLVLPLQERGSTLEALTAFPNLTIPVAEQDEFIEHYLAPLSERHTLRGAGVQIAELQVAPQPRVYLAERAGELLAELRFGYGEVELAYEKQLPTLTTRRRPGAAALLRIHRDPSAEYGAWQQMSEFGLKRGPEPHEFLLRRGSHPLDFLLRQIPRMAAAGFSVFGEEALTVARINRGRPTISFRVASGLDWFDLEAVVQYGDQPVPLKELRRAIRRREKYLKLADGSIGLIPEEWAERYRHLFGLAEEHGNSLRLGAAQAMLLDQALADAAGLQADDAYRERLERLRGFERIEPQPLPQALQAELRPYQRAGYDWLHFLRRYGFGGVLADDMGLGKTLEVLAYLLSLRERDPARAADLIVMPRSLLFNWQGEAARFTPTLRVYLHADQGRIGEAAEFGAHDLVLTTYGVMLRDIELLRRYRFATAVLDESQAVKNPLAETSRATRLLNAEQRLALTGTPVENSAIELWAQFAFVNPGLLGGLDYYREEFVTPIERKQDEASAESLRRLVRPFILRRTKEQVALDLPPRSEDLLLVDMEPAQRRLYTRTRDDYRAQLLGMIDTGGMDGARMHVLEGLLRLRQICNHPRLVDPKARGGSGKFELLLETLETLRAEGHRALVFSQFVQMLTIIRESLDGRAIPYAYLDGATRDRQGEVERFQAADGPPFFLISLKAGGVGLNLTAADYVIHVDPWWNPAVELQAADRSHRIGQTKPVFVYKLITRDSVEEKILQLQARKRSLMEQLIAAESGVLKSLTRADVEALFT